MDRTRHGGLIPSGLATSTILFASWLAFWAAPAAWGQCSNDCGIGDWDEGEGCAVDEYEDLWNGGCNWEPAFGTPIACGETFCGSASTYDFDGQDYRDLDWYIMDQSELIAADVNGDGVVEVVATLVSEFDGLAWIYSFQPDCSNTVSEGVVGLSEGGCLTPGVAMASIYWPDHPFGILVIVAPDLFDGLECTTGINDYTLNVVCNDPPQDVCLATGFDILVDGFLEVCPDSYGAWTAVNYGGLGDLFNPLGPLSAFETSFTSGLFIFNVANSQRELLAGSANWQSVFGADASLDRAVELAVTATDTDGDLVDDSAVSSFRVTGTGLDLGFDLVQSVEQIGPGLATLTQTYTISNDTGSDVDFSLVRALDADLIWDLDHGDDSVGTGTNGSSADRYVFTQEEGDATTAITISSAGGDVYYGSKNGVDPDGAGPGPAMGFGTDVQLWNAYGVPDTWENYIAGVGADVNGESGQAPAGCLAPCDAHIALEIPISMTVGQLLVVEIVHTFGDNTPFDAEAEAPTQTTAAATPSYEAVGDLDGNGIDDVVAVLPLLGGIQVFRNLGDDLEGVWQGFLANPALQVGANPSAVTCGDYNTDGHLDLAVTNRANGTVSILINTGEGNAMFTITDTIAVGDGPSDIRSENFAPDPDPDPGHLDLGITLEDAQSLVTLQGDGAGNFVLLPVPEGPLGFGPVAIFSDDFDGNKCPDMTGGGGEEGAGTAGTVGRTFIAHGQPDGSFDIAVLTPFGVFHNDVAANQLDNDLNGFTDIAVADVGAGRLWILIGDGDDTFFLDEYIVPDANGVAIGDFNYDGFNDIALALADSVDGPALGIMVNQGPDFPGEFGSLLTFGLGKDATPFDVETIFLNGDCLPDVVVVQADPTGQTNGALSFLLNVTNICPTDLNFDGVTDTLDFLMVLGAWGPCVNCPAEECLGDIDGSCDVGATDFLAVLAGWGPCPCE